MVHKLLSKEKVETCKGKQDNVEVQEEKMLYFFAFVYRKLLEVIQREKGIKRMVWFEPFSISF